MQLLVDATGRKPIPIGREEATFTYVDLSCSLISPLGSFFVLLHASVRSTNTDNRAKQTGTEESGKFHFIPYLQDIDRDTGRDYAQ